MTTETLPSGSVRKEILSRIRPRHTRNFSTRPSDGILTKASRRLLGERNLPKSESRSPAGRALMKSFVLTRPRARTARDHSGTQDRAPGARPDRRSNLESPFSAVFFTVTILNVDRGRCAFPDAQGC